MRILDKLSILKNLETFEAVWSEVCDQMGEQSGVNFINPFTLYTKLLRSVPNFYASAPNFYA